MHSELWTLLQEFIGWENTACFLSVLYGYCELCVKLKHFCLQGGRSSLFPHETHQKYFLSYGWALSYKASPTNCLPSGETVLVLRLAPQIVKIILIFHKVLVIFPNYSFSWKVLDLKCVHCHAAMLYSSTESLFLSGGLLVSCIFQ